MRAEEKLATAPAPGAEAWATLAFVLLISVAADFASGVWKSSSVSFSSGGLSSWPPDLLFQNIYFNIYYLGMLIGGLLTWRYGFRTTLGLFLVWEGLLLVSAPILDLEQIGRLLSILFRLGFGLLFPACCSALAVCLPSERRALPLLVLVFILPKLTSLWVGLGWDSQAALGLFFQARPSAYLSLALTGTGLLALAWRARLKNPRWLDFGGPRPQRDSGPGEERAGYSEDRPLSPSALKIDASARRLILAGLCAFGANYLYILFLVNFNFGGPAPGYANDYAPLLQNQYRGGFLVILAAILVQVRGSRLAWPLLVGALAGQTALYPLWGALHSSPTVLPAIGLGLGFCMALASYSYYLLLMERLEPAQAGLLLILPPLLADLFSTGLQLVFQTCGLSIGLWWLVLLSWITLAGALLTVWARVRAGRD